MDMLEISKNTIQRVKSYRSKQYPIIDVVEEIDKLINTLYSNGIAKYPSDSAAARIALFPDLLLLKKAWTTKRIGELEYPVVTDSETLISIGENLPLAEDDWTFDMEFRWETHALASLRFCLVLKVDLKLGLIIAADIGLSEFPKGPYMMSTIYTMFHGVPFDGIYSDRSARRVIRPMVGKLNPAASKIRRLISMITNRVNVLNLSLIHI